MAQAVVKTDFKFPKQKSVYNGKVRDVYNINDEYLVMVVTDRISAFDVVLPKGIPYKGQVLNQIAEKFLDATADIVPNWKISVPDPMVTIGHYVETFPVEMIVRGYLTGSSWRLYNKGGRDENISREEIIKQGLVSKEDYELLEKYSLELFKRGSEIAKEMGLILVDTKYEFGKKDGKIYLIDEIHTPDSSRYFYLDGYDERQQKGENQKQLSKEFVREWLMEQGFQGEEEQNVPEMPEEFVNEVSERYIELYEKITGDKFVKADATQINDRIEKNVTQKLNELL